MIFNDPVMLLSYVNTQLRDNYSDLEDLCNNLNINKSELISKLENINYIYNEELNQFK